MAWKGKEMTLSKKEIVLSLLSDWRKQRRIAKKKLDKPGNSQLVQETIFCGARLKTYKTSTGASDRIFLRAGKLIGITTVNLGVVCKLIFAFYLKI